MINNMKKNIIKNINLKKVKNIALVISFVPITALTIYAVYKAIFGYDVYTWILPQYVKTVYGLEAMLEVFVWYGLCLTFIPVLPVCFIYQVICLVLKIIDMNKNKKK